MRAARIRQVCVLHRYLIAVVTFMMLVDHGHDAEMSRKISDHFNGRRMI